MGSTISEHGAYTKMSELITGVEVNDLKVFKDERGAVMRMMRRDDPFFREFGEIYFSIVMPNVVKAWHLHKSMTLNYACVFGKIKLVLYDPRVAFPSTARDILNPTCGMMNEFILGGYPDHEDYKLVTIPPGVWNGFRAVHNLGTGLEMGIVANCATEPHNPNEIERHSPDASFIPYDWGPYEVAG